MTPEEIVRKLKKITVSDIQTLAKEIFTNERLNMAVIGPVKDKKGFVSAFRI